MTNYRTARSAVIAFLEIVVGVACMTAGFRLIDSDPQLHWGLVTNVPGVSAFACGAVVAFLGVRFALRLAHRLTARAGA